LQSRPGEVKPTIKPIAFVALQSRHAIDYNSYMDSALVGLALRNTGFTMLDQDKSKQELVEELAEMRQRLAVLEAGDADRKQAEAALRESEERYRTLLENIHMGITVMDRDCRIVMLNKGSAERIGGPAEECIGQECFRAFRLHDAVCPDCPGVRAMSTGQPAEVDHTGTYRDGRDYVVRVRAYPIFAADGRADGFVELIEDIAARKKAQDALERERQSLWKMLQASDHERQTIAYEIHDGLAQFLAAARMQFQACDSLSENSPEEARKAYESAVELVCQAHAESRRLINEVRPPIIDEIGLETAILHLVHEQRKRGGPTITLDSDVRFGKLLPLLENALYRIAQEALTNACKHSQSREVRVVLAQEGQNVRLEVRDSGTGFDVKSVKDGHFGLEGIRQRVRLLGGRLAIESGSGAGTLIKVVVPLLEKQGGE
jgi:PAS domain S-box-containing protein